MMLHAYPSFCLATLNAAINLRRIMIRDKRHKDAPVNNR